MVYQVYKILDSDTLNSLADRLNISSDEIIRLNGIDESDFISGNMIVIPKDDDMYFVYDVQSGDSMYKISKAFDQDVDVLYSINGIKEGDYLYPNQKLLIPRDNVMVYFTKEGDSLTNISDSLNLDIERIIDWNPNLFLLPDQIIMYKRD